MFICHCRAVTDRAIRTAIEAGAADPRAVGRSCGAGSRCGGCWPALEALLAEYGLGPDARPDSAHAA